MSAELFQVIFEAEQTAPVASSLPYQGIEQLSASGNNATFSGNDKSIIVSASGPKLLDMPSLAVVAFEETLLRLVQRADGEELLQYPYQDLSKSRIVAQSSEGIELKKFSETLGAYFFPEKDEWVVFEAGRYNFLELGRLKKGEEPLWAFSGTWSNVSLGFDTTANIEDLVFYGGKSGVGFFVTGASALLLSDERTELEGVELTKSDELVEIATGFQSVLQKLNEQVGIRVCEFIYALEQATAIFVRVLDSQERLHELTVDFDGVVEQNVIQSGVQAFHSHGDTVALLAAGSIWVTFSEDEVQKLDLAENEAVTAIEFGIPSEDKVIVYYTSAQWESEVGTK